MNDPSRTSPAKVLASLRPGLPLWAASVEVDRHQARLAEAGLALASRSPEFLPPVAGLLYWAWQERPLVKYFLDRMVQLCPALPQINTRTALYLKSLEKQVPVLNASPLTGEADTVFSFLAVRLERKNEVFFWLDFGFEFFLNNGLFDHAQAFLGRFPSGEETAPILVRFLAELEYHRLSCGDSGRGDAALRAAGNVDKELFPWWREYNLGRVAGCLGDTEEQTARFSSLWREIPWHTNLTLVLHDLLNPVQSRPGAMERVAPCVLLYTWNKAELLQQTLGHLEQSELGEALVVVLDNGSSDATPAVLARAKERWEQHRPGRFLTVRLPVNVGAPAARNWLLSLEAVRGHKWIAFLDDDLILEPDWLVRLACLAEAHPDAGAAGLAIRDHAPPHALQSADFNAMAPDPASRSFSDFRENIFVFNNCAGVRDCTLFSYTRPCLSVTGCCHLVSREALDTAGRFDIKLTPSQFDDLDRDLASFLAGKPALYHGGLPQQHVQFSSMRQASNVARSAHILGNKLKLEHKYEPDQAKALLERNQDMLWDDLLHKAHGLERMVAEKKKS